MAKHSRSPSQDFLKRPSTKRAKEIDAHSPLQQLDEILASQEKSSSESTKSGPILHWFRSKDIRAEDNKALSAASKEARKTGSVLLTMYLYSPKDLEWHGTSPARSDFLLESLSLLRKQLHEKNIPLAIITAPERAHKSDTVTKFIDDNDVAHVFANYEYEVDELRRDISTAKRLQERGVGFSLFHDQTVVEPGAIKTGSGGPMKVFTPYHKAWLAKVAKEPELLHLQDVPAGNEKKDVRKYEKLFQGALPELPDNKRFKDDEEKNRIRALWPAGHAAGMKRLEDFLSKKVKYYAKHRSEPARDPSSRLSAYFSAGIISVREALTAAKSHNGGADLDGSGDEGIASWTRELVFREFYRQMLVAIPHNAMNLPQNLKFDFVQWEDDEAGWRKWCEGKTGVPFVDAGMRQLNTEAYMHNRLRMNVSSYLTCNLLLDYRRGERYFAEHLVDWDLANNTQGWEPSYTVFNPVAQAEKCDRDGDFIRKWVPELRHVKGKAVFAPHARLSEEEFDKLGYPRPHVDFKRSKDRAVARFKRDLAEANP